MSLYIGSKEVLNLMLGSKQIDKIMLGSHEVWSKTSDLSNETENQNAEGEN